MFKNELEILSNITDKEKENLFDKSEEIEKIGESIIEKNNALYKNTKASDTGNNSTLNQKTTSYTLSKEGNIKKNINILFETKTIPLKVNIFEIENFKKGRIESKRKLIGIKVKHNDKAFDNVFRKIIHSCAKKLDLYIWNRCAKRYSIDLFTLCIKKQMGKSLEEIEAFIDTKILNIYLNSEPRRKNQNNIEANKKKIELVLKTELEDDNCKIKILNIIFAMNFKEILIKYLNNKPYIEVNDNHKAIVECHLNGFITFKKDLKKYSDEDKKLFKDYIDKFLEKKD